MSSKKIWILFSVSMCTSLIALTVLGSVLHRRIKSLDSSIHSMETSLESNGVRVGRLTPSPVSAVFPSLHCIQSKSLVHLVFNEFYIHDERVSFPYVFIDKRFLDDIQGLPLGTIQGVDYPSEEYKVAFTGTIYDGNDTKTVEIGEISVSTAGVVTMFITRHNEYDLIFCNPVVTYPLQ